MERLDLTKYDGYTPGSCNVPNETAPIRDLEAACKPASPDKGMQPDYISTAKGLCEELAEVILKEDVYRPFLHNWTLTRDAIALLATESMRIYGSGASFSLIKPANPDKGEEE